MLNKFNKLCFAITVAAAPMALQAETVVEYAKTCMSSVGISEIPSFSCSDGIQLTLGNDSNAYLGTLNVSNPLVDAVYLCRGASSPTRAGLVGVIITNRLNKDTCFFDTPRHSGSVDIPGIELNSSSLDAAFGNYWKAPQAIANDADNGQCHTCHANDPMNVTEDIVNSLSQLDLLNNGRDLKLGIPYRAVGEVFSSWNFDLNSTVDEGPHCAEACHRLSVQPDFNSSVSPNAIGAMLPSGPADNSIFMVKPLPIQSNFNPGLMPILSGPDVGESGESWSLMQGRTPTGKNFATGPRDFSDTYLYVETSLVYPDGTSNPMYTAGNTAIAQTELIDLTNATLSLDYFMYGSDVGFVDVQIQPQAFGGSWMSIATISGVNDSSWHTLVVDLSAYAVFSGPTRVRLKAVSSGGFMGDIAIDNFLIQRN